ncbi:MAG: hypothetical protein A3B66_06915 [Alphaproteobacteria bacterium RIFCSPHIGHO2_02_FULL_46_13]|nr:MAG: hypothetical protein A3B66_06915 [Alphaproteobacteria bacterium RIFCSPHIGHO2_02_FULL_46_13]
MKLFRLRKKIKINLIAVDVFLPVVEFLEAIESYFNRLNPYLFSVRKCNGLNEFTERRADIDFFIHYIKDKKHSYRIYITSFNKKIMLPLPITTRASLDSSHQNNIFNVQIYAVYILSLLVNRPNHPEVELLKKLFINELSNDVFNQPASFFNSLGFESILILVEIYRNAGLAFLDQNLFMKSRQLEDLKIYFEVINESLAWQDIEINKARALAFEGVICSHTELIGQSLTICRSLLLKGKLSTSKIEAINTLMSSSFEVLRKYEKN